LRRDIYQNQTEMKTIDGTRDTIINVINYRDDICILGPECKKHNHQMVEKLIVLKPQTPENFDLVVDGKMIHLHVNEFGDTMTIDPKPKHVEVQKIDVLRFDSDTIRPCDSQLIQSGDNRLTSEFIQWPVHREIKHENENFDGVCFALTLGFMTFISLKYIVNSFDHWVNFIDELKIELMS
jgi:hypothetical protein